MADGWVATSYQSGVGVVVSVCSGGGSVVRGSVSKKQWVKLVNHLETVEGRRDM